MRKAIFKKKDHVDMPCYIINIKIHSDETNKQKLYSNLFYQIFNFENFSVKIGNKNGLELKKLDKLKLTKNELGSDFNDLEYNFYEIFNGEFVKYKIEDKNDKHYHTIKKELQEGDPDAIIKPNAVEIPFYVIPAIHRVFLPVKPNITPSQVKLFFDRALLKIYGTSDFYNIDIAKSSKEVNEIYNFKTLTKLNINISYTNDDLGGDAKLFMDTLLKDAKINRYVGQYSAENNKSINTKAALIKGGIELSKENGEVNASGEDFVGNKIQINTKNNFEKFNVKLKKEMNPLISILKETLTKWRLKNE